MRNIHEWFLPALALAAFISILVFILLRNRREDQKKRAGIERIIPTEFCGVWLEAKKQVLYRSGNPPGERSGDDPLVITTLKDLEGLLNRFPNDLPLPSVYSGTVIPDDYTLWLVWYGVVDCTKSHAYVGFLANGTVRMRRIFQGREIYARKDTFSIPEFPITEFISYVREINIGGRVSWEL